MSNYSRHFDDGGGGGYDGGGRGGYSRGGGRGGGRFQSANGGVGATFDGKHQRKPVQRKAVDYNAVLMRQQSNRMLYRDYRDRPALEATSDSVRALAGVVDDVSHNPALGICTKYISLAVNKTRAPITALAWMPDGRRLVTGSHTGEFTQWNGLQFNFEGIVSQAHDDPIRAMTWSHNDLVMLTADEGGVIKYWQSSLNNTKAFKAHKEPVRDLSFAPNDLHFVSCSDDQTASIWDLETSQEVVCLKGHGWDVKASKWHPTKGIILTGSKDQLIKVWDPRAGSGGTDHARTEHCLADLHAHKNTVNRLAWSPSNPYWFLSGSRDNLVKVFDIRTMRDFQTNRAHKKEISALTWHPTNERLFASGSLDGTIHQWFVGETESQAEITGAHDSAVYGLQWHPLGHLLASASNDHTTRFWARNRPGDDMTDKYNVSSLPAAQKAIAVSTLVEAAQKNPSKYGRLPASLAEFAQQGQQEMQEAMSRPSNYADASGGAAGSDFIPGMGQAPGMGIKREAYSSAATTAAATPSAAYSSSNNSYADVKPSYSSSSSRGGDSYAGGRTERRRSRSRERDSRDSYTSRTGGASSDRARYGTTNNSSSSSSAAAPPSAAGGYNAFFPSAPAPAPVQSSGGYAPAPAAPSSYGQAAPAYNSWSAPASNFYLGHPQQPPPQQQQQAHAYPAPYGSHNPAANQQTRYPLPPPPMPSHYQQR